MLNPDTKKILKTGILLCIKFTFSNKCTATHKKVIDVDLLLKSAISVSLLYVSKSVHLLAVGKT